MEAATRRIALTIAGSDSGGGAGVQADLRTFEAFGCYGTTVVTAITAQNTLGVRAIHPVPADIVRAQLDAVAEDLAPAACKTGMLVQRDIVAVVAATIAARRWPYVLDPVLRSTSGTSLLDAEGAAAMRSTLVPLATCVTPNLDEAEALTGEPVRDPAQMLRAAEALRAMGAAAALVTGGHLASATIVDVLVSDRGVRRFEHQRIPSRATHGTGCVLSAAITAGLARSAPLDVAVRRAIDHVRALLSDATPLGTGVAPAWSPRPRPPDEAGAGGTD